MPSFLISDTATSQAVITQLSTIPVGIVGVSLAVDDLYDLDGCLNHPTQWRQVIVGVAIRDLDGKEVAAWTGDLRQQFVTDLLNTILVRAATVVIDDATGLYLLIRQTGMSLRWASWFQTDVAERCLRLGLVQHHEGSHGLDATLEGCRMRYVQATPFLGCSVQTALTQILAGRDALRHITNLARTALAVYDAQVVLAGQRGLLPHLLAIEMPAAIAHLGVTWDGVYVDPEYARRSLHDVELHLADLTQQLAKAGLTDPDDTDSIKAMIRRRGPLHVRWFQGRHGLELDGDRLKEAQAEDPIYGLILRYRQCKHVLRQGWLRTRSSWPDGRWHPVQVPVYADTGRSQWRTRGVAGLPKEHRHLIRAATGNGIVEIDYGSMEMAIAAVVYQDMILLQRYMSGDALGSMEEIIFSVAKADAGPGRRNLTKRIVYGGVFYGASAWKVAKWLGISEFVAKKLLARLEAMFPRMQQGMRRAMRLAVRTKVIPIGLGLVRHVRREDYEDVGGVERMGRNTAIQGMGAVIFKKSLILVTEQLRDLGAKVIIINHDAVTIEAPLAVLPEATAIAKSAMIEAFQFYFPEIIPRIKVTNSDTTCWNLG